MNSMFNHSPFSRAPPSLRCVAWLATVLTIGISCDAFAGISTDNSLGHSAQALTGPNYLIPETLGKLSGSNLFHSFQTFNILTGESANFTTATSGIANVISRVTGGSLSQINGLLKLTPVSGAPNFFFINPAGVTFGAGASIDVPGAFHVSTADTVKFSDGNFSADLNQTSTFSSASPEAFGFLGTSRASITVDGGATLSTKPLQPISIVAGDIEINNGTVSTQGGDIRVVALGQSAREVGFTGTLPAVSGNLAILNGGLISADTSSSDNAGSVRVSAGSITIDRQGNSSFTGISSDAMAGTGNAGSVEVTAAGNLSIINGGVISSGTSSSGNAGTVRVNTGSIVIDGQGSSYFTGIASSAEPGSSGNADSVDVTAAGNLSIVNAGYISSDTWASGNAGSVKVNAGSITIDGQNSGYYTGISSDAAPDSTGNAGSVEVTAAGNLSIVNGGEIASGTFSSGDAGSVEITAAGNLSIVNAGYINSSTNAAGNAGSVTVNAGSISIVGGAGITGIGAYSSGTGNAGTVNVAAIGNLSIVNFGEISSSTGSSGNAGSIMVLAGTLLVDSGMIHAAAFPFYGSKSAQAGNVTVTATDSIMLSNGGRISITNNDNVADPSTMTPTSISVTAPRITILNSQNAITTSSTGNVAAGGIKIIASDKLYLDSSGITTASNQGNGGAIEIMVGIIRLDNSQIATSVTGLTGNGGNINIKTNTLILNTGFIQANTAAANASGGTVSIAAQNLIPSGNTLFLGGNTSYSYQSGVFGFNVIQAAAPTGVSGTVQITSPVLDISGSLSGLNTQVIDTGGLGRSPCQVSGGSSLAQSGRGGLPPSARGLLRAEPNLSPIKTGYSLPSDGGYISFASSNWGCS